MKNVFVGNQNKSKKGIDYTTAIVVSKNTSTMKVTLKFPNETSASGKEYKYNPSISLYVGNRVLLSKKSGTYYVIARLYN